MLARCIVELERIYGIRKGSAGKSELNNSTEKKQMEDNITSKSKESLAEELGITRQHANQYKKLLTLIPELQDLIK